MALADSDWLWRNIQISNTDSDLHLKETTKHLNLRISGQYIPRKTQAEYLGLTISEHLDWDLYFSQLKNKLNCGIGLLAKIRHFTSRHLLKTLYFSLFNLNLIYGCQICWQDQNEEFKNIEKLQEKALRIISFLPLNATVEKQMYEMNILKLKDSSCFKISYF